MELSTEMAYNSLKTLNSGQYDEAPGSKKSKTSAKPTKLPGNPHFQAAFREIQRQRNEGFNPHPKMDKLRSLVIDHFAQAEIDQDDAAPADGVERRPGGDTRMMVFISLRECVDEIVEMLERDQPLIRPARFVGQGLDKNGRKGLAQKDQLDVRTPLSF